ncbi:MAG: hypothetical protein ACTSR7_15530 [Promethearchaeota archaeon]
MGIFKIDLLDFYFSEKHELKSPKMVLGSGEKVYDIGIFKNTLQKYLDLFDFSKIQNPDYLGERPIQDDFNEFKTSCQENPRLLSFTMDLIKFSHENFHKMWETFYFYDEFLHENFSKMMDSAKKEESSLLRIIEHFQKERINGLSLWLKTQSTLFISEIKAEARLKIEEKTLSFIDLDPKQWDIFQRLNQRSTEEQQMHVYQWCREFGSLIEDQFKRTIFFISLINNLINTKKMDSTINHKFMSVHQVLSLFSKKFTQFDNIKNLPHFRNSASHETFSWNSSHSIENSTIRFADKTWAGSISFETLILIYYKLVILVATFELVVMNTQLSLLDNTKSIDLIIKEIGKQLFQQMEKPLREWLENGKNDQ